MAHYGIGNSGLFISNSERQEIIIASLYVSLTLLLVIFQNISNFFIRR